MNIVQKDSVLWLEPQHINLNDVAAQVASVTDVDVVRRSHSFDDPTWAFVAQNIAAAYRQSATKNTEAAKNEAVNRRLAGFALAFPPYGTVAELRQIETLLVKTPPDIEKIADIVFGIVMHPRIRALQQVGRFNKIALLREFAGFINAAGMAYYRGNVIASFMTLLPVIEGILLRWQGYPSRLSKKPDFQTTKTFLGGLTLRQPVPLLPAFVDAWVQTVESILDQHLYKPTTKGGAVDNFNRHLALHMLENKDFATKRNVMRGFLLLDLLSEVYVCETRMQDPRWDTTADEEAPYLEAYLRALFSQMLPEYPEAILHQKQQ